MEPHVKEDPSAAAANKNGEEDDEEEDDEWSCEEEERVTSTSASAARARQELEADSMSSGIVFNYEETDNGEMHGKYRASHVLVDLGWVDLDLGSSPGWRAATLATCCPSRMVEHPKSMSSKPSLREHGTPCRSLTLISQVVQIRAVSDSDPQNL